MIVVVVESGVAVSGRHCRIVVVMVVGSSGSGGSIELRASAGVTA